VIVIANALRLRARRTPGKRARPAVSRRPLNVTEEPA